MPQSIFQAHASDYLYKPPSPHQENVTQSYVDAQNAAKVG